MHEPMLTSDVVCTRQQRPHRRAAQHKLSVGRVGHRERHVRAATSDQPEVQRTGDLGVFLEPSSHILAIDTDGGVLLTHAAIVAPPNSTPETRFPIDRCRVATDDVKQSVSDTDYFATKGKP